MKTNNVHVIKAKAEPIKVLLLSDLHWDNPKCDRELLKKHLDQAKEQGCPILLNGDTFPYPMFDAPEPADIIYIRLEKGII